MINKTFLFFLLCLLSSKINSQSNYQLIYQTDKPTMMGVELMTSMNYIIGDVENKYLKPNPFKNPKGKTSTKILNGFYRFSKTLILDATRDAFISVFQHEVFGHGARLREFGYTKNRYYVGFPFGGGTAWYGEPPENRIKTIEEEIMIRIGGVESTMLLSNKIRNNWIENEKINLNGVYLFVDAFANLGNYIRLTDLETVTPSNDIYQYYRRINELNDTDLETTTFTIDYLKKRAIINYINPLQYYAAFALIKDYIVLGKNESTLPMIPIGSYKYLPFIRMGLTPFGTEIYMENFVKNEKSLNTLYVRIGDNVFHEFYGMGLKKTSIIKNNRLKFDAEFDIWKQPSMDLGGEEIVVKDAGVGYSLKTGLGIKLFDKPNASYIYGLFGYKSAGYLEGEFLREGFFARFGVMLME